MLIFLLCFNLHYDLINCNEINNAKFSESLLLDNHHQNRLQINAVLKDVQQKIHEKSVLIVGDYENEAKRDEEFVYDNIPVWRGSKAPGTDQQDQNPMDHKKLHNVSSQLNNFFQPSPQYDSSDRHQGLIHWLPPVFPGFKVPLPPLVIPRPSKPYLTGLFPLQNPGQKLPYPGYLLRPMHSMYHRRPRPRFLSDHRYQNIYLRPLGSYMTNLSHTPDPSRPRIPPFPYAVDRFIDKNPHLINSLHPAISPLISDPAVSSKTHPPVTIPFSIMRTSTIGYNAKIWLEEIAPYTPVNDKLKKPSKYLSAPHRGVKTVVPITKRMSEINDYWFSTAIADTGQLFNVDEHGFLYVTLPEKDGKPVQVPTDPNKNRMSTTAGDVLHGKITVQKPSTPSSKQRYLDLMEQIDEGYMMVFIIELCRMIAVKDRREVGEVLHHTEMIYNSLWNNGRLAWIGDPLETVSWRLSLIMSDRDIDLVRTYASMMFHMLLQRQQTLSAEVNAIIDTADLFYDHDKGDRLLYSLKQFEDYPKTTKTSYWLCATLIESFLLPFRRPSDRRQRLIDSINKALKQRFPLLLREHNKRTLVGKANPKNETQSRKRKRKRKRKRHYLPYKKKRVTKGDRTPEFNNTYIHGKQFSQDIDSKESVLRTMTPVTSDQPRLRAATTKDYRMKNKRPTTVYLDLLTRSTRNRKPSYQKTSTFQEKLDSFDRKYNNITKQTVHHHHHFSQKTSTASYRPPRSVTTSTGPVLLTSSGFHTPSRSKGARKDKIPFYQMKEELKESGSNRKVKRLKLKAELLRKITEDSSYSDELVPLIENLNEALKYGTRNDDFADDTK